MRVRHTVLILLAVLVSADMVGAKPNVVVILTDDQGWGDVSLNGNGNLRTPNIDSLAQEGARFERFFVQPVCSPTRAEFLTGRYHPRGGVRGVSTGGERLNLDESTIADSFRKAGYATACYGKWHNGSQFPYHPNGRGFDDYFGFTSGHWADYFDAPLEHNGQEVRGQGFLPDEIATRAIAWFKKSQQAQKPFFAYLAFNTPHSPMQVPEKYWDRFKAADLKFKGLGKENLTHTRAALAMCENLDDNIGRVLAALQDLKLERETLVVYFHDNGPNGPRWNGNMKGQKGSTDEGGVRSPLHVRWPGQIPAGKTISEIAAAIDLLPTLCSLCEVKRVGETPLDGIDFSKALRGQPFAAPDRFLFQHWAGKISVRSQRYRFDATGQLFDMVQDPNQAKSVASENPRELERHRKALDEWKANVLGGLTKTDDRPYPVGYAEFPRSVLPARDGIGLGGIQRSANAPNCSYFTNWTQATDAMTWNVEVATAGKYEAIVRYTCGKADLGSRVKLELGKATWTGVIAKEHDPPLRGKETDRVSRGAESYMKDFAPLSLGVLELPKGHGTLKLSAPTVAGQRVADVRAVELIRQK